MPKDVPNASNSIQGRSSWFVQGRDSQIVGGKLRWGHSDRARHSARSRNTRMLPSLQGQSRPAEVHVAIPECLLLGTLPAGVHSHSARFAHIGRLHPHARAAAKSPHASSGTCCCTTRKNGIAMASKQLKNMAQLKRIGQPKGVADVVAFLASDDARRITGASIPVDGGSKL
jgi:hypothetical protein